MLDNSRLGERIYIARKNKGLKQDEMCTRLGIHQSGYSDIENGKRIISVQMLCDIASVLEVSVSWLVGEDQSESEFTDEELYEIELFKSFLISKRK